MGRPEILVVGAGVSGLTTAVYLAEAGHSVRLIADKPPARTTSAAAGASWGPYQITGSQIMEWTEITHAVLEAMSDQPDTGVRLVFGVEVSEDPGEPPEWATKIRDFQACGPDDLDAFQPLYQSGWRYTIPLVDMPVYLAYLERRLKRAGGTTDYAIPSVKSFADLRGEAGALVNCTGLGARELVPDAGVYPTRGQLLVVENPGIDEFFQDNTHGEDLTYILPHGRHVVLGGCATDRSEVWAPHRDTAKRILKRCAEIEPALRDAKILADRVGLRPTRERVRIELAEIGNVPLIHNYGHGAAGVSLSWGCAEEVYRLIG